MGKQAKEVNLPLLDGVNEKDLQQRKIQVEQHVQNAAPHQHPDYVGMDVGRRDLGEVKKLFEERQEREPEPHVELLLREIDSIVRRFLDGYDLSVHKLKGNVVRNIEAFTKLPYVQLVNKLLRVYHLGRVLPLGPAALDEATSFFASILKRGAETKPAWRNANSKKERPDPTALRAKNAQKT